MVCRFTWWQILWVLLIAVPAGGRASNAYALDQTTGRIEFSVGLFRLFSGHGMFHRFAANLWLDEIHPYESRIVVTVDAGSAEMDRPGATEILLSPDFFDTGKFPRIRFASTKITQVGPGRYAVAGSLEIRGVSHPFVLDTRLVAEHHDAASQNEIADFVATGSVDRSAFGMTADRLLVSNTIDIIIHARLALTNGFRVG